MSPELNNMLHEILEMLVLPRSPISCMSHNNGAQDRKAGFMDLL